MARVQLALDVDDLGESVAFYSKLFGVQPAKLRDGYANFVVEDPPLKLVLFQKPGRGGQIDHLGVEVEDSASVEKAEERLRREGLEATVERRVECCYAEQDKVWVRGPDGEPWEIYTVLADVDEPGPCVQDGPARSSAGEVSSDEAVESCCTCCGG
ncbi:MAG: cadmium transporter [Acidimicrobiales bacterium]|nr:MAG: cadmium transporter [Acidimicrobiales bacterium]